MMVRILLISEMMAIVVVMDDRIVPQMPVAVVAVATRVALGGM